MENPARFKQQLEAIVEREIRPALQQHGGDMFIKEFRDNKLWISLTGACHNCPAAWITFENLIEKRLKEELGEQLAGVYLVHEVDDELLNFARKILRKE